MPIPRPAFSRSGNGVPLRAILFDLDGTLVQTREASWALFARTNAEFALGIDTREAFFELFQENLFRSLKRRCAGHPRLDAAIEHFLELLRAQYCPPLIPGMSDVIKALASRFTLAVISTNAIGAIRNILAAAGVAHCFAHVFSGDVEPDKSACIRRFLSDPAYALGRRCSPEYDERNPSGPARADEVVLVSDTVGDMKEASGSGIQAYGVAWGMHQERELLGAGALKVALWPQELIAWLVPPGSEPVSCACALPSSAPAASPASDLDARLQAAAEIRRARRPEVPTAPATPATDAALDPELLRAVAAIAPRGLASSRMTTMKEENR